MLEAENDNIPNHADSDDSLVKVTGMYKAWFLDYASSCYTSSELFPAIYDGLKPVQRRILHSVKALMTDVITKSQILWDIPCSTILVET